MSDEPHAIRQLPLWKEFLTNMRSKDRLNFGASFEVSELEEALACKEDSLEYAFAISDIRKALRREGKTFTGRGQKGERFVIAPPEANRGEMKRLQNCAISAMREGVVLGTATPLELLSAEDRRKHEAVLEKMATRLALISRKKTAEISS